VVSTKGHVIPEFGATFASSLVEEKCEETVVTTSRLDVAGRSCGVSVDRRAVPTRGVDGERFENLPLKGRSPGDEVNRLLGGVDARETDPAELA
jgi:hypothetical protein